MPTPSTIKIEFDNAAPLERAIKAQESKRANSALWDYYRMGTGRSLRKLLAAYSLQVANNPQAQPATQKWLTLLGWSEKYSWVFRVKAQEALDKAEDDRVWKERRQHVRDADFDISEKLRKLSNDVLAAAPNFTKSVRKTVQKGDAAKGIPEIQVVTMALDGDLAVKAAQAASGIGRKATGLEGQALATYDLTKLPTAALLRIADGDNPAEVIADFEAMNGNSSPEA